jgi:hypothetical protein
LEETDVIQRHGVAWAGGEDLVESDGFDVGYAAEVAEGVGLG